MSPSLARKAYDRLSTKVRGLPLWLRDRSRSTYAREEQVPEGPLRQHLKPFDLEPVERARVLHLADQFIQHRFNILGSGWRDWHQTSVVEVSPGNLPRQNELLAHLNGRVYRPIEWHSDLKSGHRYNPRTWFQNVRRALAGVEIKVPWELARFHHFHVLARAFAYTGLSSFEREIENQFYDFVANNPPRFGVNWASPMDVAIRAANWLVAVDIAAALGADFSAGFRRDLKIAIWEHGRHLRDHLESSHSDRANHYLSNLCGLIVIAAYLPSDPEGWMDFAAREWNTEVKRQFLNDGGSFEGSTCYHRLSAEMSFYAAFFQTACGRPVDPAVLDRLALAARFTAGIVKPDGRVPQIGDNDSGRFLNLGFEEDALDHRHLVTMADVAFGKSKPAGFESSVVSGLLQDRHYATTTRSGAPIAPESAAPGRDEFEKAFAECKEECRRTLTIPFSEEFEITRKAAWPDFGLYIWQGPKFFLSVRCDQREHVSMEGHCHNDVLAMDLQIDGEDLLRDPGSLVYAPQPEIRNLYRSLKAHFPTLWLEGQVKETLSQLLFTFPDRTAAEVLKFSDREFLARAKVRQGWFQMKITFTRDGLTLRALAPEPIQGALLPEIEFSSGYGCLSGKPAFVVARPTGL